MFDDILTSEGRASVRRGRRPTAASAPDEGTRQPRSELEPWNPGTPLELDWLRHLRVNRSAAERRARSLPGRRSVKREWQAAWLLRAVTCIDLTTLAGDDTPGRVRRLCGKARNPVRADLLEAVGAAGLPIRVASVCVYPSMVSAAVEALAGSGIPVAAVAAGFPAGQTPFGQRLDEIRAAVAAGASEIAETGAIPVIIGGDHSIEFANVAGLADVYGKENVGVIHFDAHYDAGDTRMGHLISHAQPVRRLVDDGHILGRNFIQVGLRGSWPGAEGFEWMRENELRYHTMAEIDRDGWTTVMRRVLDEANDGPEYLHVSFDIDVMDPAYTSGTGTPVPGDLTPREIFPMLRGLCSENNLGGFDLVELNPLVDPGYTTALNAKQVVGECLTGVALRKLGSAIGTT